MDNCIQYFVQIDNFRPKSKFVLIFFYIYTKINMLNKSRFFPIIFWYKEEFNVQKLEQLYEGKAKKVFKTDDPEILMVDYKDDATAFNGEKKGTIDQRA